MTINDYLKGLSKVVSSLVGNKLSTVKGEGNTTRPSVFIARRKPNKPEYPYAACDYVGSGDYGLRELHTTQNGNSSETYFNRRMRLRVAFYGNYDDDILTTCQELKDRFYTQQGTELFEQFMQGAGIIGVSEPQLNSTVLSTEYEEFCFITIDFWYISKVTETFTSINQSEIEGGLFVEYDQQQPPLTINNTVNFNN